jgi:hypothetical protein
LGAAVATLIIGGALGFEGISRMAFVADGCASRARVARVCAAHDARTRRAALLDAVGERNR